MTTTALRDKERTAVAPAEKLAADGGPKAVQVSGKDRWKALRWRDLVPLFKHFQWGTTTLARGGGAVADFEREFAELCRVPHALAMNSGTAALHSALFAVGVGPGDEVVVPAYTWHATAGAVLCAGARPVFCDIDPRTLTADPQDIERRITPKTKAVMVVHIWGNPAKMDAIKAITDRRGLALIEDCSHAHGATYQGKPVGAWGDIGCFSLQGGKAVSAGEGGVAVCSKREYYQRMLALGFPVRGEAELKDTGWNLGMMNLGPKYRPHLFGVLLAHKGLKRLPELNALRCRNWRILGEELAGCEGIAPVDTYPDAERGGFLEFKFILDAKRLRGTAEEFVNDVKAEGVPATADRYYFLHQTPAYRRGGPITLDLLSAPSTDLPPAVHLPHTEDLNGRVMTLPAMAGVSEAYIRQCAKGLPKVASNRSL